MADVTVRNGDYVLVGDGEKAMLFENRGDGEYANFEVVDLFEAAPKAVQEAEEQPSPALDGTAPAKKATADGEATWHRLDRGRFAKDVAAALYKQAHRNRFERLVIVAPPATLGELRKELHKEVSGRVVAEFAKDLTNHPIHEIERHLGSNA